MELLTPEIKNWLPLIAGGFQNGKKMEQFHFLEKGNGKRFHILEMEQKWVSYGTKMEQKWKWDGTQMGNFGGHPLNFKIPVFF